MKIDNIYKLLLHNQLDLENLAVTRVPLERALMDLECSAAYSTSRSSDILLSLMSSWAKNSCL
jgi:hypothetical protein